MRYPKTTEDVVSIVKEAISRGVKIKPFRSRHSQTDIICTEGIPVDMTKLTSRQMNSDGVTATFGSGITLWEAGKFLQEHNRAFRNTPAYGGITLGGAIGTGGCIMNSLLRDHVINLYYAFVFTQLMGLQ